MPAVVFGSSYRPEILFCKPASKPKGGQVGQCASSLQRKSDSVMWAVLVAMTAVAGNEGYTTMCAQVDITQSNGWHDIASNQDHFSIRVTVQNDQWLTSTLVTISWPTTVIIDHVYGASLAARLGVSQTPAPAALPCADRETVLFGDR